MKNVPLEKPLALDKIARKVRFARSLMAALRTVTEASRRVKGTAPEAT
jgi:hypothetical protein